MSDVSVVITTTGRPHFLRTALQSVQNQIGRSSIGEVIVSENNGDPRTELIIAEFPQLPIRYLFRQPTLTMVAHLFATWREVKTRYVAILNDDDWWIGNHLVDGVSALDGDAQVSAYGAASLFAVNERHKNPRWIDRSAAMWLLAGQPSWLTMWTLDTPRMLALCWVYTPFHCSSMIARTDHVLAVLDELEHERDNTYTIDRLIFAHLALRGTVRYNPVPDTFVRWHSGNLVKSQDTSKIQALVRSTREAVQHMASSHGWNVVDIWSSFLRSMPAGDGEAQLEILERFHEVFTDDELEHLGLSTFFHRRRNHRLAAMRHIAANAKKLMLGCS